jgi:hypothetical protein
MFARSAQNLLALTQRIYRIKRSIGTKPASCAISVRFHSLINPSDLNLKEYIAVIAMTNSLRVAAMVATKYSKPALKRWNTKENNGTSHAFAVLSAKLPLETKLLSRGKMISFAPIVLKRDMQLVVSNVVK